MWPFPKKRREFGRVLLIKNFGHGMQQSDVREVVRLGDLFAVCRYSGEFDGRDVIILEPAGATRGLDVTATWERIDDIPGLTDAAPTGRLHERESS